MTDHSPTGDAGDQKAIAQTREAHVAAVNAGDPKAWAARFTDDGVQMPPNMPANVGREAIAGWSGGFMSMFRLEFALAVDEVRVLGDWAFERGGYTITLHPKPEGPSMQDAGKYITIYQRQPGNTWRIARDIWNSNNPLPGQ